jgi:hypothetical protein
MGLDVVHRDCAATVSGIRNSDALQRKISVGSGVLILAWPDRQACAVLVHTGRRLEISRESHRCCRG